jgi:hypothetical protein
LILLDVNVSPFLTFLHPPPPSYASSSFSSCGCIFKKGKLWEVGVHETVVTQKGVQVTIPNWAIENITLPPALYEPDDIDKKVRRKRL